MTLDEAIKHAEEVAEDKEIDIENQDPLFSNNIEECKKCAEEHRQLAEWLKDYKRLLKQESCNDCVSKRAVIEKAIAKLSTQKKLRR